MGIRVRCPECAAEYELADRLAGKKVRCKGCEAVIPVPDGTDVADDAPPARRPAAESLRSAAAQRREDGRERPERPARRDRYRDEKEDEDDRPRANKSSALPLLLILCGGGAALLLVLLCGGLLVLSSQVTFSSGPPPAAPPIASSEGPKPPPVAEPNNNPGEPKPEPRENPKESPRQLPRQVRRNPPPEQPKAPTPPPLVLWQVQPDPLPADLMLPQNPEGSIPITGYPELPNNVVSKIVFPTTPSPFVSVAVKGSIGDAHEVWDLRTMKRVGRVEPKDPFTTAVLSPDGAYWAIPPFMLEHSGGADVYAAADNHLYRVPLSGHRKQWCEDLDFAAPGQVMMFMTAAGAGGVDLEVQIHDIKTRTEVRQFTAPAHYDRKQRAFSPGRRYLALASRQYARALLYDLTTGLLAGEMRLPDGSACLGLAFAPDGRSFAALVKAGDSQTHLLTWDLASGARTADHTLAPDAVPKVTAYLGPVLECLPDGGWLLNGRTLLDGRGGAVSGRVPLFSRPWYARRIFPGGRLASVKGEGRGSSLVIEPLPASDPAADQKVVRDGDKPSNPEPQETKPPTRRARPRETRPSTGQADPALRSKVEAHFVRLEDAPPTSGGKPMYRIEVEMKNRTGKDITRYRGTLRFVDPSGKLLYTLGWASGALKADETRKQNLPVFAFAIGDEAASRMKGAPDKVKAEFQADSITFSDGSVADF
jgi:predicted Zn finger-like uncharacterized protein